MQYTSPITSLVKKVEMKYLDISANAVLKLDIFVDKKFQSPKNIQIILINIHNLMIPRWSVYFIYFIVDQFLAYCVFVIYIVCKCNLNANAFTK